MKWLFYIFGIFCFCFAPAELIPASTGLILIGMIFHLNDVKNDIIKRLDEIENLMESDHTYLKRDIKDLGNKK